MSSGCFDSRLSVRIDSENCVIWANANFYLPIWAARGAQSSKPVNRHAIRKVLFA